MRCRMSAITETLPLTPFAQMQQFCSAIGQLLGTLCEKTESAFRRVHLMKKDADGNIKFYDVKDQETGETKKISVLSYIEEIETGDLQKDEAQHVVAQKCAWLALGIPFYTVGAIAWNAFKIPVEICSMLSKTLKKVGEQLALQRLYEGAVEMRQGLLQIPGIIGDGLFEVVKAQLFGFGAEIVSLCGIIKPYRCRKIEALIESAWHGGVSYKEDFRKIPKRPGENCLEAFVKDVQLMRPFYLAHCFQVRGNVNDPNIEVIRREAL